MSRKTLHRRPITLAFLLPSLLLGLALFSTGCFSTGPADTVEQFYRNVEKGKLDDALELVSDSALSQLPAEKLKQGLQQATRDIDSKGGIDDIEILSEDIIGDTAEITVKITFGNGDSDEEDCSLIKEDGAWKLQLMGSK